MNRKGQAIVIQDTGIVAFDAEGNIIFEGGPHESLHQLRRVRSVPAARAVDRVARSARGEPPAGGLDDSPTQPPGSSRYAKEMGVSTIRSSALVRTSAPHRLASNAGSASPRSCEAFCCPAMRGEEPGRLLLARRDGRSLPCRFDPSRLAFRRLGASTAISNRQRQAVVGRREAQPRSRSPLKPAQPSSAPGLMSVRWAAFFVSRPDLKVDLRAVDGNICRRCDTQAHLLTANTQHRDLNLIADHDALLRLACKD